jgi:hypothetical protein
MTTTKGVNFVLQWGATQAVSQVWGFSEVDPLAQPLVFTFQITSKSPGGIPRSTARAALFLQEWQRARSSKIFSTKVYKKWLTLRCVTVQPRWAERVYLQGRSIHGCTTEIRYLTKRRNTNLFGGTRLTLRGTKSWSNPWWLIVWGEAQLNRKRYV